MYKSLIYTYLYIYVFGIEMTKTKKEYLTPQLTVVQFKVERGYAASNVNVALGNLADAANHFIEERSEADALWTETFNTQGTIENRQNGASLANSGWLANDAENPSYF